MEARYKIASPRREVRERRSFDPDEFAIALDDERRRGAASAISNDRARLGVVPGPIAARQRELSASGVQKLCMCFAQPGSNVVGDALRKLPHLSRFAAGDPSLRSG